MAKRLTYAIFTIHRTRIPSLQLFKIEKEIWNRHLKVPKKVLYFISPTPQGHFTGLNTSKLSQKFLQPFHIPPRCNITVRYHPRPKELPPKRSSPISFRSRVISQKRSWETAAVPCPCRCCFKRFKISIRRWPKRGGGW